MAAGNGGWDREMSSMKLFRTRLPAATICSVGHRSYGSASHMVQTFITAIGLTIACAVLLATAPYAVAAERPVKIVVLGDSLTAGFGLPVEDAFPAKLDRALKAKGQAVEIVNAGVSGDTASGGLDRVDWSVPEGTDAVILELGANDALRGIDPKITRAALEKILRRLEERHITVLLCGMRAPPNMGTTYTAAFDAVFTQLAAVHDVVFYPFFLDAVAAEAKLNQRDGIHPNVEGVDIIVDRILPKVEELIARVRAKTG
jgi:acyl-CoA thioesterase-1